MGPSRRAQQEPTAGRSLRVWPLLIVVIGVVCGLIIAMLGETTWRLGGVYLFDNGFTDTRHQWRVQAQLYF